MTPSMVLVLAIVSVAVVLFVTEWLRYDVVAILVLLALALTGLITHEQALAGFSNEAVVTIAAVLVLSGGLARTGVADLVGRHVLRVAGTSPWRLTAVIMVTVGVLSGLMNNIAATALMLPVVVDIARRIGEPASKLLIPLAFASLLGGMTTLIGTAPNILVGAAVEDAGLAPLGMFAFTPVGATVLLAGTAYMILIGRHLLPARARTSIAGADSQTDADLGATYDLAETLFAISVPRGSPLDGRTLAESRLGRALGLNVLAVTRGRERILAPPSDFTLRDGDRLIVEGRRDPLETLKRWKRLAPTGSRPASEELVSADIGLAEITIADGGLTGQTLAELSFRTRYRVHVLAIRRGESIQRIGLQDEPLVEDDVLLVLGRRTQLEQLGGAAEFSGVRLLDGGRAPDRYELDRWLLRTEITEGSWLDGRTLEESQLGDAFDLLVLEIERAGKAHILPAPGDMLRAGDRLLIEGRQEDLHVLDGLQELEVSTVSPKVAELESGSVGLAEVALAPRSALAGKTIGALSFQERYGLSVLAIWRGERAYHSNVRIRDLPLALGDALLVYGPRRHLAGMAADPNFVVLAEEAREAYLERRAPLAAGIMAGVIAAVSIGLLPIYIAAPAGALLMVLSGCQPLDDVYRVIEWKVIMLIAGMLGLGVAMEQTGAAGLVAEHVLGTVAALGKLPLVAGLFAITALAAQIMPTAAVAVLMSPIALSSAADLGLSPHAVMMVVAVGASCAFISPFGHAVNLLVMGAGGYRVVDYAKVGVGLVLVILLVVLLVLPLVWPLAV